MMADNVKFTCFTNTKGRLSKRLSYNAEGKLQKAAAAAMYQGKFETINIPWDQFGNFLLTLKTNQAISLGVCNRTKNGQPLTSGRIVKNSASWDPENSVVSRSKECFSWHGTGINTGTDTRKFSCSCKNLILLDLDGLDATSDIITTVAELIADVPLLQQLPMWAYSSSGSNIYDGDAELTGLTGLHVYLLLPQSIEPTAFKTYLETRLWLAGKGFIFITKSGSRLKRCSVDLSVFSPERLVFSAGAECVGSLIQRREPPLFIDFSDNSDLPPTLITEGEIEEAERRMVGAYKAAEMKAAKVENKYLGELQVSTNLPKPDAKKLLTSLKAGKLSGSHPVHMDDGAKITAWQLLLDPDKWDKKTCADPSEPLYGGEGNSVGKNKAIIYASDFNNVRIFSHAHGGQTLTVVPDYRSICNIVDTYEESEMEELLGTDWLSILSNDNLTQADRERLFERIKGKYKIPKAELKSMFDSVATVMMNEDLDQELLELNDTFSIMTVGSKVRIVFEEMEPELKAWTLRFLTKADFLTKLDNRYVYVWKDGKRKRSKLGVAWLEWEARREYRGTCFMPGKESIVDGYMNLFKGYSVGTDKPKTRTCAGKNCEGKGCLHWFLNVGYKTTEYGETDWTDEWGCHLDGEAVPRALTNLQFYFRHIHEVCAGGDLSLTKWCIGWLADLLQNPGGSRPGTALVFKGCKGAGKGVVFNTLGKLIQPYYFHTASMNDVIGRFNQHLQRVIMLFADEAIFSGDKAGEGVLKSLITEPFLAIESKGVDKINVRNHVRICVASNEDWVVPASRDERRFCVCNLWSGRAQDKDWFAFVGNPDLEAMLWELLNYKVEADIRTPPFTEGLRQQIIESADPVEEFAYHMPDNHPEFLGGPIGYTQLWEAFKEDYQGHRIFSYITYGKFNKKLRGLDVGVPGTYRVNGASAKGLLMLDCDRYKVAMGRRIL